MTSIPSPRAFKIPYDNWRPNQAEAIEAALNSPKQVVFISAPTGSGKSAIALTISKMSGRKAAIITHTKALQRQYISEFKALDLLYLIGRENYRCLIDKKFNVSEAPCTTGWKCPKKMVCDYYSLKIRAAKWFTPVISNYSYFLGENTYASSLLSRLDVLVLDEGHLAENALMAHVNVTLEDEELRKVGIKLAKFSTIKQYKDWTNRILSNLSNDLLIVENYLKENDDPFSEEIMLERHRKLSKVASVLMKMHSVKEDWLMESFPRKVMFRPLWVKDFGHLYTNSADKVIIQSATIVSPKKMAELMGIEDFDVIEVPSAFPKERRPFYYYPVSKVDQSTTEEKWKTIVDEIDNIIDKHDGERGIIHTVNYRIRDMIMMRSKHANILLSHKIKDRDKVIEEFLTGEGQRRILISPSVMSGLNAPYHRCSFQVICKVPFRDRKEEQVKRRMQEDPEWYAFSAACDIVQAYGRAMRYADDFGVTYMLDENFGWFYRQNYEMFPGWFKESVTKISRL